MALVDSLINRGYLKTETIIRAFRAIKRVDFLPEDLFSQVGGCAELEKLAELDDALPIGYGQTISQPAVVAFMLELLQPQKGDKILDVGSGSGWTTALLAEIVAKDGRVFGIEAIKELQEFGERNVSKYNFISKGIAQIIHGNGTVGFFTQAPYDKILASAAGTDLPKNWLEQLKVGGRLVAPVKNSIWLYKKTDAHDFEGREYPGFVFVPLVTPEPSAGGKNKKSITKR